MKIGITKDEADISHFRAWCLSHHFSLTAQSFLQFEEVTFDGIPSDCSAIFFGSPRSVEFFLNQYALSGSLIIGCVGAGTAKKMISKGIRPHFVGRQSGDALAVGKEWRAFIGDKKCFFPLSDQSLQTVVQLFPDRNRSTAVVYRTLETLRTFGDQDIYIFTSPSNVRAFFRSNDCPKKSTIIAWGTTTALEIEKMGRQAAIVLDTGSWAEVKSILLKITQNH